MNINTNIRLALIAIPLALALTPRQASANLDSECERRFTQRVEGDVIVYRTEITCPANGGGGWWEWFWDWVVGPSAPGDIGGPPGTSPLRKERTDAINTQTIRDAKKIFDTKPDCNTLLTGHAGKPLEVLESLEANNRITAGGAIDMDPVPDPSTVAKVSGLGQGRSGTIKLFGIFYGTTIIIGGKVLTTREERVVALLHELGHLTADPGCSPSENGECTPTIDPYRHTGDPASVTKYENDIKAKCLPIP